MGGGLCGLLNRLSAALRTGPRTPRPPQEGKLTASLAEAGVKRAALRARLVQAAAQLEQVQAHLRVVRAGAEAALSAAYGGRPVHIMGSAVFF